MEGEEGLSDKEIQAVMEAEAELEKAKKPREDQEKLEGNELDNRVSKGVGIIWGD